MSKSNIRKITVDPTKCNTDSRRLSVFERLGTKPITSVTTQNRSDYCRNWALNGSCSYGKNCNPSKRAKKDNATGNTTGSADDPFKRLTSKIVKKASHSPDLNLEEWNQTDLEYEDEKVLERRRQLLQRELEIQMKKDKEIHGKEKAKQKKKNMSSSSSSHTSSSSSSCTSSSSEDSSSSSTSESRRKVKKLKPRKHSISADYVEHERKKKIKLKRLGAKDERQESSRKTKLVSAMDKKDTIGKLIKKSGSVSASRKRTSRTRSPGIPTMAPSPSITVTPLASSITATVITAKGKERDRSESPRSTKLKEMDKDRHYKKMRDLDETSMKELKMKNVEKPKELEKEKSRLVEEKLRMEERTKGKVKEKDRRSRTPSVLERAKQQYSRENLSKSRRSRTPDKSKTRREGSLVRHQEKSVSSGKSREVEKKEREMHKPEKSKDKEELRKIDQIKSRQTTQEESHNKRNLDKVFEERTYVGEKRAKSRDRREKDHNKDEKSHIRVTTREYHRDKEKEDPVERIRERGRDRDREKERERERDRDKDREKERDREQRDRERDRDREREKERDKEREKDLIKRDVRDTLISSTSSLMVSEKSRYKDRERLVKESLLEKAREHKTDRARSETKANSDRDRNSSQRLDGRYERNIMDKESSRKCNLDSPRDRERFHRERSLDKNSVMDGKPHHPPPLSSPSTTLSLLANTATSSVLSSSTAGSSVTGSRDHLIDKEGHYERDRHRRFAVRYDREQSKKESRTNSTKSDRIVERRDLSPRRAIEINRNFGRGYSRMEHWDEQEDSAGHMDYRDHKSHDDDRRKLEIRRHHHHHKHPLYSGEKTRGREEGTTDNWNHHHELELDRDRYGTDWEEREWRSRSIWDNRENLPRSETQEEEWSDRYENSMVNWKVSNARKWDSQSVHLRGHYRSERTKNIEINEPAIQGKRRSCSTTEPKTDIPTHPLKQSAIYSMKDEPINKKLMELAEGKIRTIGEKHTERFHKKIQKDKSEVKEHPLEPKKEESVPTLHTESDLSDISDDPDDILNMEEDATEMKDNREKIRDNSKEPLNVQKGFQSPVKESVEDSVCGTKSKDSDSVGFRNIDDENIVTMDFEEISDGELEEDIKTSGKGLGDALGVDWESLVTESQPKRDHTSGHNIAQSRWQCKTIFQRIGISTKCAGKEVIGKLSENYGINEFLLNDIAVIHMALARTRFSKGFDTDSIITGNILYRNDNAGLEDEFNIEPELLKPYSSLYEDAQRLFKNLI
ncbi:zinc finger CCCH domain-containing protein 13-like isoform X2 [Prorops nasuta]|uniref:zinc finger CCCH domain-containing protein 13-like isoform X2 n=1 Tax=Prorops nasuta TaxID=863751 RepID=UPI0034CFD538